MKGLPREIRNLISKARESVLLAVETYNRPTAVFRSGAYVVLVCLGLTALFHAIFLKRKIRPWHKKRPGSRRYAKIDGDYKAWELVECLNQFYKDHNPAERKNIEFFIGLRNKIEHRSYPEIDQETFGECQSLLLNFEELLCTEFGEKYALKTGLVFSLQFSRGITSAQANAVSKGTKDFKIIRSYIDKFRSNLAQDIQGDSKYSFKVFLVPKIGNHASSATLAVEFVKYDPSKPEEMKKYEHLVAMIKPKEVLIANQGLLKPGQVIKEVSKKIGKPFTHHSHGICYRHFNVRPAGQNPAPGSWDSRYCHFDALHKDYGYTPAWIEFLVGKLSDDAVYNALRLTKLLATPLTT